VYYKVVGPIRRESLVEMTKNTDSFFVEIIMRIFFVLCVTILGCLVLCPVSQAVDQSDIVFDVSYHDPDTDDLYDDGLMFDVMVRGWYKNGLGFGVAVGAGGYRADGTASSFTTGTVTPAKASGNVWTLPIGMSGLYQIPLGEDAVLSFDAGFRYVTVHSDADLRATLAGVGTFKDEIDIDNGWTGVIGLNYERQISDSISWLVGGGYQFDLAKGEAEWRGIDLGDNELESVFLRIGMVFKDKHRFSQRIKH